MRRVLTLGGRLVISGGRRVLQPVTEPPPADGASAYQLAQQAGFAGTEADWRNSLDGPAGWTPMFRGSFEGSRTLFEIYDWWGGAGQKPTTGYLTETGGLAMAKAEGFNFNKAKRLRYYQAITAAGGIATLNYAAEGFTTPPVVVPLNATTAGINGTSKTSVVGSPTATSAQLKVEVQALVTGALTVLVGATVNALVIES